MDSKYITNVYISNLNTYKQGSDFLIYRIKKVSVLQNVSYFELSKYWII